VEIKPLGNYSDTFYGITVQCNLITAVEEEKWSGSEQESGEGLSVIQVSIRSFIRIVRSMRAHFD